jgi:hypothetical protein
MDVLSWNFTKVWMAATQQADIEVTGLILVGETQQDP